jgi:glucan biosynthesis protein C
LSVKVTKPEKQKNIVSPAQTMTRNTTTEGQPDEAFALSALWASTLLLGIVIHSAVTYGAVDYHPVWTLQDQQTHPIFDWVVSFIHSFRMPLFFLTSGYFAAKSLNQSGLRELLKNIVRNLLIPFVGGVFLLWPLVCAAFAFSRASIQHIPYALGDASEALTSKQFLPLKTGHLWFLYFLILLVVLACAISLVSRKSNSLHAFINKAANGVFQHFWVRFITLATALFLCLCWMGKPFLLTNHRWTINPAIFTTYFIYFGWGWMVHKSACLTQLKQHAMLQLVAGLVLFVLNGWFNWPNEAWALPTRQALVAVFSTLFVLGFTSLFLTYCTKPFSIIKYSINASYWVYWIHLPFVAFVPGLWSGLNISSPMKFLLTLASTGALCLLSHRFLVRNTALGKILNGVPFQ